MRCTSVAILGSGNIGTDLMVKIRRRSAQLEVALLVGIDPASDGLSRARQLGVPTSDSGIDGLLNFPAFDDVSIVFDATSATAHHGNAEALAPFDVQLIDLTPAALGPFVVPSVNLDRLSTATDLNLVTCGGQATIPIVAAVSAVTTVHYAEIVATIASQSAGPGTRCSIDEFTQTTAKALRGVGGARQAKAIIILNPAEPPMLMRDTVHLLVDGDASQEQIREAIGEQVRAVAEYVPGYRLKQETQFQVVVDPWSMHTLVGATSAPLLQVSVYLEVEGAADYLPAYAGNLDIMTSAAVRVAERLAERRAVAA